MVDFENLSDEENEKLLLQGYRLEVGRKDPEGNYWIGFVYIPINEIDPNIYQDVSTKLADLKMPWEITEDLLEFFSNPSCGILHDIKLLTDAFHIDEIEGIHIVDDLDEKEGQKVSIRILTALRAANMIPEFLIGTFSVGKPMLGGKTRPTLILTGTWIPPEQRW